MTRGLDIPVFVRAHFTSLWQKYIRAELFTVSLLLTMCCNCMALTWVELNQTWWYILKSGVRRSLVPPTPSNGTWAAPWYQNGYGWMEWNRDNRKEVFIYMCACAATTWESNNVEFDHIIAGLILGLHQPMRDGVTYWLGTNLESVL